MTSEHRSIVDRAFFANSGIYQQAISYNLEFLSHQFCCRSQKMDIMYKLDYCFQQSEVSQNRQGSYDYSADWCHLNSSEGNHRRLDYFSTVCSGADQRKHQSSALLDFVRGIHRWPVNSPHRGSVTRKMFPFDDVIVRHSHRFTSSHCHCPPGSGCKYNHIYPSLFINSHFHVLNNYIWIDRNFSSGFYYFSPEML